VKSANVKEVDLRVQDINYKWSEVKRWFVETDGSNFAKVIQLPEVDYKHCMTTNLHEVQQALGIEAMRLWMEENILYTMSENGTYVDRHHVQLLCSLQARRGMLTRASRQGIKKNPGGFSCGSCVLINNPVFRYQYPRLESIPSCSI
jgi:DNA-directed RNA polymerase beta' subunit